MADQGLRSLMELKGPSMLAPQVELKGSSTWGAPGQIEKNGFQKKIDSAAGIELQDSCRLPPVELKGSSTWGALGQ